MSVSTPTKLAGAFLAVSLAGCAAQRPYGAPYYSWSPAYQGQGANTPSALRDDAGTGLVAGATGWGVARALGARGGVAAGIGVAVGGMTYLYQSLANDCAGIGNASNGSWNSTESCRFATEIKPDFVKLTLDGKQAVGRVTDRIVFKEEGGKPSVAYLVVANGQTYIMPKDGGAIPVDLEKTPGRPLPSYVPGSK